MVSDGILCQSKERRSKTWLPGNLGYRPIFKKWDWWKDPFVTLRAHRAGLFSVLSSWGGDPRLRRRPGPRHRPAFINLALQLQCLANTQQYISERSPHGGHYWPCLMPQGEEMDCTHVVPLSP